MAEVIQRSEYYNFIYNIASVIPHKEMIEILNRIILKFIYTKFDNLNPV
jgi:hypothetical protein